MKVVVDACVWSDAFRKNPGAAKNHSQEVLLELAALDDALLLGPVRQEVLSGIRDAGKYAWLKDILRAYPDVPLLTADYESAAQLYTTCRGAGIQGSNVDFLVCAVAQRLGTWIFTTDKDFQHFSKAIPIRLYKV
jgi:predicted nucleic acid-binding protein